MRQSTRTMNTVSAITLSPHVSGYAHEIVWNCGATLSASVTRTSPLRTSGSTGSRSSSSTAIARGALIESGMRRDKRKQYIDRVAATLILQSFLDSGGWKKEPYRYTGSEVFHIMDDKYDGNMEFDNIVELVDDEGKNVKFEFLMALEHEGAEYILLTPAEEIDGVDEDEVVILKVDTDDKGEDVYVTIDDEDLMETLFEKYLKMVESEEDEDE